MSPFRVLLLAFAITLLLTFVFRERMLLPSEEMESVLLCYKSVASAQVHYKARFGAYANLPELLSAFPNVFAECDRNYVLRSRAVSESFVVEIVPAQPAPDVPSRRLSLYAGEDGQVRVKYGGQHADATTPVLSLERLRNYVRD